MKLLEEIKREHDEVRGLILEIENNEDSPQAAMDAFRRMVVAVLAHHEAEEQEVFTQLPDEKEAQELKRELIAEHDSLRRELQVVLDTPIEDDNWKARLTVAKEVFNHHIEEEEKELFEILRDELKEEEMASRYKAFEKAEQQAKTRTEAMLKSGVVLRLQDTLPRKQAQGRKDISADEPVEHEWVEASETKKPAQAKNADTQKKPTTDKSSSSNGKKTGQSKDGKGKK